MELKQLFSQFVRTLADAEHIDDIHLADDDTTPNRKKADYFFDSKNIICEQKSLDADMLAKVEKEVSDIVANSRFRLYGTLSVDKLLDRIDTSGALQKKVFDRLTKSVAGNFETAHAQIRATKERFELPQSKGVLLILNEASFFLSPSILMRKVSEMFNKRTPQGELRYREISAVWIILFSHQRRSPNGISEIPSIKLLNNVGASESDLKYVFACLERLDREFAKFLKLPYHTGMVEITDFNPKVMPSIKIQQEQSSEIKLPRKKDVADDHNT